MDMFRNRAEAGRLLAVKLIEFRNRADVLILGLPRGGVPVAFEVARALHAPLDVLLVRKLGAPGQPELAIGAVAEAGIKVIDQQLVGRLGLSDEQLKQMIASQEAELHARQQLYKDMRPKIEIKDRIVIVVDDGIATGASMLAAVTVLRLRHPQKIVVAVPVASLYAQRKIKNVADSFVGLQVTDSFPAVGAFYHDFSPTEDAEVRSLLVQSAEP